LFAPILALPVPENHYHPLTLSSQQQRQKTLETIVAILLELAERQPVLFRLPGLLPIYSRLFHLGLCQTQGKPETDRRETYALKNTQEEGVIPKERSSCLCSSPLWQRSSGPSCGLPAVTSAGQPRA